MKYTKDGKKVRVVGALNKTETIVQEIFVTADGSEIPSGENFTVGALFDEPVQSWLEKRVASTQERLKEKAKELRTIEQHLVDAKARLKSLRQLAHSNLSAIESIAEKPQVLDLLAAFLSGDLHWVVSETWQYSAPQRFEKFFADRDGVKLLSVAGRANGDLQAYAHRYADGGGGQTKIYFFETEEQAIEHIRCNAIKAASEGKLSFDNYAKCRAMGIVFPGDTEAALKDKLAKAILEEIAGVQNSCQSSINKSYAKLKALEDL